MPVRRSTETTLDLFSGPPTATVPARRAAPPGKAKPKKLEPRHLLPRDLAGALKRLDDAEIDALLAAVTVEAEHRGRLPSSPARQKRSSDAETRHRHVTAQDAVGS